MDTNGTREARGEYPSGWLVLTSKESVAYIVDALLDLPERREFNQTELADLAGVSRKSVNRHIKLLKQVEVVEPVPDTTPTRYRFNPDSEVSQAIMELDNAMNKVGPEVDS